jgi:hypothetical protein
LILFIPFLKNGTVMENVYCREMGPPSVLMRNSGSAFYSMAKDAGLIS